MLGVDTSVLSSGSPSPLPPHWRYPEPSGTDTKCILCIVFACLSFVGAALVLAAYFRLRECLRRPVLDCLVLCIVLALPGSINLVVSAALRLRDRGLDGYCRWSFYFFQQFTLATTMMEGCFFLAIVWSLAGGTVTTVGVRRMFAFVLLVACIAGTAPIADLPIYPPTGTELGSSLPWCWLPEYDGFDANGNATMSPKLVWFKFIYGYIWGILAMFLGFVSCLQMIYHYTRSAVNPPSAVKWRLAYCIMFTVFWLTSMVPRVAGDDLALKTRTDLEYVLAIVAPGMPFFNSVLFFLLEAPIKSICGPATSDAEQCGVSASCRAYDGMCVSTVDNESLVLVDHDHSQHASTYESADPMRTRKRNSTEDVGLTGALNQAVGRHRTQSRVDGDEPSRILNAHFDDLEGMWVVDLTKTRFDPDTDEGRAQAELIKGLKEEADKKHQVVQLVRSLPKPPIGVALSFVGGYCDACGFVTMDLFTAHVTGNIVLIGSHIGNANKGSIADIYPKIVAIPVFVTSIAIAYGLIPYVGHWHKRVLLGMQLVYFFASFCVAINCGPFTSDHMPAAWAAGQLMVAGMAIQNTYQRTHLVGLPMTTFMTGNTNQMVHDVIEIVKKRRAGTKEGLPALYKRLQNMAMSWVAFIVGCMLASVMARIWGMWCYLPPVLSVAAIIIVFWEETEMPKKDK